MIIDPRDRKIPFPRANNHIDMDPSCIIPIIFYESVITNVKILVFKQLLI